MNPKEAKSILLLCRPGTVDAEDPRVAEALALAKSDPELARWLEGRLAGQEALRATLRQIIPPAGLKEQIISEVLASRRKLALRRISILALASCLLLLGVLVCFWLPRRATMTTNTLAHYQVSMVRTALGSYSMDLMTNDPVPIRVYLAQQHAPADFTLPQALEHTTVSGCAVRDWQGARVSLICFRTGKPLPPNTSSDLWLFVVDRASVPDAPVLTSPQISRVKPLSTATWTDGGKLYFLGVRGSGQDIAKFL